MKKILYFYPENPLNLVKGNNKRANSLLKYFKTKNFSLDLIGVSNYDYSEKDMFDLKSQGLINEGWLLKKNISNIRQAISYFLLVKLTRGILKIFWKTRYLSILDVNSIKKGHLELFESKLKNNYDIIIISYSNWAGLIKHIKKIAPNSRLIIDTHDFITSQYQNQSHFDIGYYFKKEINALTLFDEIWAISIEEHFLFSQFLIDKSVRLIPHGTASKKTAHSFEAEIDLLYIASDNPHNVKSIKWFLEFVYPLLNIDINITIIGKICNHIDEHPNIDKIEFAESLDEYYSNSKICLCPMLSGTGLKIKVVEALSYGLPVVCNQRGVDGLLNKTKNGCLVTESEIEFANNITQLLSDKILYTSTKRDAISFFEETLSKTVVSKRLNEAFNLKK